MAIRQYPVEVHSDHLEKITRAKPVQALAELVWNSLDADASKVSVSFETNQLATLDRVSIRDNGTGLRHSDAPDRFRRLGGSWKKLGGTTQKGRFLHGQEGRGRFKVFSIGSFAEWYVNYVRDGRCCSYTISMSASDIRHVSISDEVEAAAGIESGVTLVITEPIKDFRSLNGDGALTELAQIFALYLADYPDITITVSGEKIDPMTVIASRKAFNLTDMEVAGRAYPGWKLSNGTVFQIERFFYATKSAFR